jgi:transcriptional repressor NF-X1
VFKTPRFVSAPRKTLAQCLRTAAAARPAVAAQPGSRSSSPGKKEPPFNALLLSAPRFGVTIDEIEDALRADLAGARRAAPAVGWRTVFVGEDEVVVRAEVKDTTAAAVAANATPAGVEGVLKGLKGAVAATVAKTGVAGAVALCRVDGDGGIVRREGADSAGWSAVAGRGAWRRGGGVSAAPAREEKKGFGFVALRRLGEGNKKETEKDKETVEEDWLAAAEKIEGGKSDGEDAATVEDTPADDLLA